MTTVKTPEQIFTEARVDVAILGNTADNVTTDQRKAELKKLVNHLKGKKITKTQIVDYVKSQSGTLSPINVSKWLKGDIPIITRGSKPAEGPSDGGGKTHQISEIEYFALESFKKEHPELWENALKNGFEIKKQAIDDEIRARFDKEQEEAHRKIDEERDAILEKLTAPAK